MGGPWYNTKDSKGQFVRSSPSLGTGSHLTVQQVQAAIRFKAEADRYHLYVSLACPWAHRTLIFRELKGFKNYFDLSCSLAHG